MRLLQSAFSRGGHAHHGGRQWPTLQTLTGRPPLLKTGELMRSIFSKGGDRTITIGSTTQHAVFHQQGTQHLPKRPIIVITHKDLRDLKRRIKQDLERVIRRGS